MPPRSKPSSGMVPEAKKTDVRAGGEEPTTSAETKTDETSEASGGIPALAPAIGFVLFILAFIVIGFLQR